MGSTMFSSVTSPKPMVSNNGFFKDIIALVYKTLATLCFWFENIVTMLPIPIGIKLMAIGVYDLSKWQIIKAILFFKQVEPAAEKVPHLIEQAKAEFRKGEQRVAVVTGANAGLGFTTSEALAKAGYSVVMACRNLKKGLAAAHAIRSSSGNPDVICLTCDVSDPETIRDFVTKFENLKKPGIDLLVNNAGIMGVPFELSKSGVELQFASNHLGHFLLTHLLLPHLKKRPFARILNVSSLAHIVVKDVDYANIKRKSNYHPFRSYASSKLANVLFTYKLNRELQGSGISVTSCHPGCVNTDIFITHPLFRRFQSLISGIVALVLRDTLSGAAVMIYLCLSPELSNVSGKYFCDDLVWQSSLVSYDIEKQDRLWNFSLQNTGIKAGAYGK